MRIFGSNHTNTIALSNQRQNSVSSEVKNVPRSAKEIADIFQLSVTHMTKGCKKFDEIMNINKQANRKITLSSSKSDDFIKRFCSKLSLDNDIAELCEYSEKWKKYDEDIKNNKNNSHNKSQNITQKNFKGIIKTEKKKTNKTFKLKKKYIRKTRKLITI